MGRNDGKKKTEVNGSILDVHAKTVNKETVIEIKYRMKYSSNMFTKLGSLVQTPCFATFERSQGEINFGDDEDGGEG